MLFLLCVSVLFRIKGTLVKSTFCYPSTPFLPSLYSSSVTFAYICHSPAASLSFCTYIEAPESDAPSLLLILSFSPSTGQQSVFLTLPKSILRKLWKAMVCSRWQTGNPNLTSIPGPFHSGSLKLFAPTLIPITVWDKTCNI